MQVSLVRVFSRNLVMGIGVSYAIWTVIMYFDARAPSVWLPNALPVGLGVTVCMTCLLTQPALLLLTPRLRSSIFIGKRVLSTLACARVAGMLMVLGYIRIVFRT
jgi:hypothetical protein